MVQLFLEPISNFIFKLLQQLCCNIRCSARGGSISKHAKHKLGNVDFPLKQDPQLHRWWQYCDALEVLVADHGSIAPWKMAEKREVSRDLFQHDDSVTTASAFLSESSFSGSVPSHNFLTETLNWAATRRFRQESMT